MAFARTGSLLFSALISAVVGFISKMTSFHEAIGRLVAQSRVEARHRRDHLPAGDASVLAQAPAVGQRQAHDHRPRRGHSQVVSRSCLNSNTTYRAST